MNKIVKKLSLLFILVFLLFLLSGCDNSVTDQVNPAEINYLTINLDNKYAAKNLKPGRGRFAYQKQDIAEIEFETELGYKFEGWSGPDARDIPLEPEANKYYIRMNKERKIIADFSLEEFLVKTVKFDNYNQIIYSEAKEFDNIPADFSEVVIAFNNQLNANNQIVATVEADGQKINNLAPNDIKVENNFLKLFWDQSDEVNNYFESGKTYELIVNESSGNNIFDSDLNEIKSELKLTLNIKAAVPEKPKNPKLTVKTNTIEISWLRSSSNTNLESEEYVFKYELYQSIDKDNFENDDIPIKLIEVDNPEDQKIIRTEIKIDSNMNLEKNNYIYKIKAVNENDQKSAFSSSVNTKD